MTMEDANKTALAASDATGAGSGHKYPGTPRWVKLSGIIIGGLILLVVLVLLVTTALGLHRIGGPGGHGSGHPTPSPTPLSRVVEDDIWSDGDLADYLSRASVIEHSAQSL